MSLFSFSPHILSLEYTSNNLIPITPRVAPLIVNKDIHGYQICGQLTFNFFLVLQECSLICDSFFLSHPFLVLRMQANLSFLIVSHFLGLICGLTAKYQGNSLLFSYSPDSFQGNSFQTCSLRACMQVQMVNFMFLAGCLLSICVLVFLYFSPVLILDCSTIQYQQLPNSQVRYPATIETYL